MGLLSDMSFVNSCAQSSRLILGRGEAHARESHRTPTAVVTVTRSSGRVPACEHAGRRFPVGSRRARMGNKSMSGPYRLVYTRTLCDWKYLEEMCGFKNAY